MAQHNTCSHSHCHHAATNWWCVALSFTMLIAGLVMNYCHINWFQPQATRLAWFIVAYLPVGFPVISEAWENIRQKDIFNEFTLMTIASIGAFAIGEYPEAVAVMLFYIVGETLQHHAVDRATNNIAQLLDVRPEHATVMRNGKYTQVPPAEVAVGETIEIRAGERVPLDGTLIDEDALLDTSALTGESIPRHIAKGGEVLAGMLATGSTLHLHTTRPHSESALSRILKIVNEASSRKAPAELFIRRFARVYTPAVILLALLIIIVPAIVSAFTTAFHYTFSDWLYRGLVFLVISCPCALVISIPLGYFAGIGRASRYGILFKGGNYLYAITKGDCVIFDKTGTLTSGQFNVTNVQHCNGFDKTTLLTMLASAESHSTHPIAKAIVAYASHHGITIHPAQTDEKPGYGIKAIINQHKVLAGNIPFMQNNGIDTTDIKSDTAVTTVACAIDGKLAGAIMLADTPKEDSHKAIMKLKQIGLDNLHILSGDKQEVTTAIGNTLGITNAIGGLLPSEKAKYVETMTQADHNVIFVGDGMNDAPVLALSNVGIAMGGLGSDAAIESADVVIQTDSPSRVATAIQIGRSTSNIVKQNIIGAVGIKIIILLAGAMGCVSLWAAVFADVGVAMLAVLNSMRILGKNFN